MNTLVVGDLVLWKGIEMTVTNVVVDTVWASSNDECGSTRVMAVYESFALLNPPPTDEPITYTGPQVQS